MKGIIAAIVVLLISLVFGQMIDENIDNTAKTVSAPVQALLYIVKAILGYPDDIIEIVVKIIVLAGITLGGEAI
ncbi:MAG: hypothetical protein NTV88_04840 [Candidatus Micrarchaeota archaeon]|nr:hypothetical protein [Candidatus Micrarchaeota archaeon]